LAKDPAQRKKALHNITESARRLLCLVEEAGSIRADFIAPDYPGGRKVLKKDQKSLEKFGLIISHDEHTPAGHHENVLESWNFFQKRKRIDLPDGLLLPDALETLKSKIGGHKSPFQI
jgi:hypothetical protein